MHKARSVALLRPDPTEYSPFSSISCSPDMAKGLYDVFSKSSDFNKRTTSKRRHCLKLILRHKERIDSPSLVAASESSQRTMHASHGCIHNKSSEEGWASMRGSLDYQPASSCASAAANVTETIATLNPISSQYSDVLGEGVEDRESTSSNICESTLVGSTGSGSLERYNLGLCGCISDGNKEYSPAASTQWYDDEALLLDYSSDRAKLVFGLQRRKGKMSKLKRALGISGGFSVLPRHPQSVRNWGKSLQFLLKQHAQYRGVLEVVDCEDMAVAYRKISRSKQEWCDTFHEVSDQAGYNVDSDNMAAMETYGVCSPVPCAEDSVAEISDATSPPYSESLASIVTVGSYITTPSLVAARRFPPSFGSTKERSHSHCASQEPHPQSYNLNPLWEISSPCPNRFPLHCRDARGAIDPVPLTSMVLDRYQFCYRFQLAGNKMMWLAKEPSREDIELHCHVRGTLVAILYSSNRNYQAIQHQHQHQPDHSTLDSSNNSQPRNKPRRFTSATARSCHGPATEITIASTMAKLREGEEGEEELRSSNPSTWLPRMLILPLVFAKLHTIDPGIVESFILFTGIEALECFCVL